MRREPEITIARGHRRTCFVCGDPHDVTVAIDRATWVCAPCTKALHRVGAVLLKAEGDATEGDDHANPA